MKYVTQDQFDKHPYTDTWTTEREDLDNWTDVRDQYMGKRTMLDNDNGNTVLLIEGLSFEIYNPDDWPYPAVTIMWREGNNSWREVSERIYWDQLECVPPARMRANAFMVGEPYTHDERGAVHTAFIHVDGRYFCRHDNLIDFNPALYTHQVKRQFQL